MIPFCLCVLFTFQYLPQHLPTHSPSFRHASSCLSASLALNCVHSSDAAGGARARGLGLQGAQELLPPDTGTMGGPWGGLHGRIVADFLNDKRYRYSTMSKDVFLG